MFSTLILPFPETRGDSRLGRIVSRADVAEAVVGRASALVTLVARSRFNTGDRSLVRLLASMIEFFVAHFRMVPVENISIDRPERALPITHRIVTPNRSSAVGRTVLRTHAAHPLTFRAVVAESPATRTVARTDETRDPDQRDSARNASRHPRGRRAR